MVRAAVALFGHRAYGGVPVDDLVEHLGVHRNSLYKTVDLLVRASSGAAGSGPGCPFWSRSPRGCAPGTHVPGVVVAGTFHEEGERVFRDVRDPARAVVIEPADQRYARLIVGVADPRATVALIESAAR